mmetsp:Transcript_13574/g.14105  ORF Transcript_13574/g.14105 Transcript_13574/m.14105 type:complete len:335 (-) Transcript_13574:123-1127(-)
MTYPTTQEQQSNNNTTNNTTTNNVIKTITIQFKPSPKIYSSSDIIEVSLPSNQINVPHLKQLVFQETGTPPQFIILVWGGKVFNDSDDLTKLSILFESTSPLQINVLVHEKFQTLLHSYKIRCPIGGQAIHQPVKVNRRIYSRKSMKDWTSGLHTAFCPYTTGTPVRLPSDIDHVYDSQLKDHLLNINLTHQDNNEDNENNNNNHENNNIMTINLLAEMYSILELVKEYLPNNNNDNGGGNNNNSNNSSNSNSNNVPISTQAPVTRSERPGRPEKTNQSNIDDNSAPMPRSNLSAPRAGGQQSRAAPERSTRPSKQVVEEEDDFGDTDVASLLD